MGGELFVVLVHQALVAVDEADDLHAVAVDVVEALGYAAHGGVEGLAVAAAGEHSDPFHDVSLPFKPYCILSRSRPW